MLLFVLEYEYFVCIYILPLSNHGRMTVVYYIGYLSMQGMIKMVDLGYFFSLYIYYRYPTMVGNPALLFCF